MPLYALGVKTIFPYGWKTNNIWTSWRGSV